MPLARATATCAACKRRSTSDTDDAAAKGSDDAAARNGQVSDDAATRNGQVSDDAAAEGSSVATKLPQRVFVQRSQEVLDAELVAEVVRNASVRIGDRRRGRRSSSMHKRAFLMHSE